GNFLPDMVLPQIIEVLADMRVEDVEMLVDQFGGAVGDFLGENQLPAILFCRLALGDDPPGNVAFGIAVILSLYVEIRADRLDCRERVGAGDDADIIDKLERGQHFRPQPFRKYRPSGPLVDKGIGHDRDHQYVAVAARSLDVSHMPDVKKVEAAMGEDNNLPLCPDVPG